jgi:alanyl-tRNA synthetase
MKSQQIRQSFVDFFVAAGHRNLPSASLVPDAFSTTLFTIAGMEQFVPVFLGDEPAPAPRAVTVQRCLRVAGGKNDLDNVGRSGRHGTFLEMLGNFSFGDYYKREAIGWAWQYLTATLGIAAERLSATVYVDDDEAAEIWRRDIGLPPARISRFREDNFWDMGPTGPCGPDSEIFYDLGPAVGCGRSDCTVGCAHCNRYIELWNLVFQQYDRDAGGELHPLPRKCIDTGMGFERLCMVLAGKTSIFDTDLYQDIMQALPQAQDKSTLSRDEQAVQKRIIADHARAAVFMAADGIAPSNTDRGYVMRFLIRRALSAGRRLRVPDGFFSELVAPVVATLADGYPFLVTEQARIRAVLAAEERVFDHTLTKGELHLASALQIAKDRGDTVLSGESVFVMHDTFGYPPELTAERAKERGLQDVDMAGYRALMDQQRERARRDAHAKRAEVRVQNPALIDLPQSEFVGYEQLQGSGRILALYDHAGARVATLPEDQAGIVILDRTPFYAERGGQAGDRGVIVAGSASFDVVDTHYQDKSYQHVLHRGTVSTGELAEGQNVEAVVDPVWRREIRRHHSVTHLLQRALKDVVGESVAQRGSAVFPDHTRFDFDAPGSLSREQERAVESRVNELIRADYHRGVAIMPFAEAVERGAIFMKGENYGDIVRVVSFGPSVELCGGTHVESTGEIGHFILASESAIAAGVRRVEGVVSDAADRFFTRFRSALEQAGSVLTAPPEKLPESVARLAQERRELEKQVVSLQAALAAAQSQSLVANAQSVAGIPYLALRMPEASGLKQISEALRGRWSSGVLALAAAEDGRVAVLVTVSEDLSGRVPARKILDAMMPHVGGKGGGSAASAQGGGKNAAGIDAALAAVPEAIQALARG